MARAPLSARSAREETFSVQARLLRMEIIERSGDMNGIVGLPSQAGRAHAFLVRSRNRRLARDFENLAGTLGDLGYPRRHPARHQAALPTTGAYSAVSGRVRQPYSGVVRVR